MKKDGDNLIQHKQLFKAQDREGNYIRPGLLFYYKGLLIYLLGNQYTLLGIINGARAIVHRVALYPNSKGISFETI